MGAQESRPTVVLFLTIIDWFVALIAVFAGALLIYAFGAGYIGFLAVPAPVNIFLSIFLLVALVVACGRFATRRSVTSGSSHTRA